MTGRVGILTSYLDTGRAALTRVDRATDAGVPVVFDSGAWSVFASGKTVDRDTHAAWVAARQAAGSRARYVGLDVIGDPDATWRNYQQQRRVAHVEPTLHYGEHPAAVDRLVADSPPWINLGGMVPMMKQPSKHRNVAAWIAAVRRRIPDSTRVHALGATHPAIGRLVAFDAVDSTFWLSAARYSVLALFDPTTANWRRFGFRSRNPKTRADGWDDTHTDGRWLRDTYDVNPTDLTTDPDPAWIERLSIISHARYAAWLSERHQRDVIVYLAGGAAASAVITDLQGATP